MIVEGISLHTFVTVNEKPILTIFVNGVQMVASKRGFAMGVNTIRLYTTCKRFSLLCSQRRVKGKLRLHKLNNVNLALDLLKDYQVSSYY